MNLEELMSRLQFATLATLVALALAPTAVAAQETRRYIAPGTAKDVTLPPFSGAVQVGKTLYLAGDIGLDANNKVPDTAEGEARLLLDRVQRTLSAAGYTMDDLVFVQIF